MRSIRTQARGCGWACLAALDPSLERRVRAYLGVVGAEKASFVVRNMYRRQEAAWSDVSRFERGTFAGPLVSTPYKARAGARAERPVVRVARSGFCGLRPLCQRRIDISTSV